jgi:hypothetical protein
MLNCYKFNYNQPNGVMKGARMKYRISWYLEGRVVLSEHFQAGTAEDVAQMDAEYLALLEQSDAPLVHFIFDMSQQDSVPDLKTMANMQFTRHPRFGWSLVIGTLNPITRFLVSTVAQINKARFRSFTNREDALRFLQEMDSSLPDLRPAAHHSGD